MIQKRSPHKSFFHPRLKEIDKSLLRATSFHFIKESPGKLASAATKMTKTSETSQTLNHSSTEDLIKTIDNSDNGRHLSDEIRKNPSLCCSKFLLKALFGRVTILKADMTSSEIACLLNALSKARTSRESSETHLSLVATLGIAAMCKLRHFNASDIANTLNVVAKHNIRNEKLFKQAGEAAIFIIDQFQASDLAQIVNAFAKIGYRHPQLFEEVANRAISTIHTFKTHALVTVLRAFANNNHRHTALFHKAASAAVKTTSSFKPYHLATTVEAFAVLDYSHSDLFDSVAEASIPKIRNFNPRYLVKLVDSFAKLNHPHPELFDAAARFIIKNIHTFDPQALVSVINAFAKVDHQDHALIEALATAALSLIHGCDAQALANMSRTLAKMGHGNSRIFGKIAEVALSMIDTFKANNLAVMVNAFAKLGHKHQPLFDEVARGAIAILESFAPHDLAAMMSAYPNTDACSELSDSLFADIAMLMITDEESLSNWNSATLVEVASAFTRAGLQNSHLMEVIGKRIFSQGDNDFSLLDHQLSSLAAAFAQYETPSTVSSLKIVYERFCDLDKNDIDLQSIADISSAINVGRRFNLMDPAFAASLVDLSIEKAAGSSPEEVSKILLKLSKVDLDKKVKIRFWAAFKPIFEKHVKHISKIDRDRIRKIYKRFDKAI